MLASGPYFNIAGYWGGPYLVDVLGYTKKQKGITLISISIGLILGSLTLPNISTLLRTKKWMLFFSSCVAFTVTLILFFLGKSFSNTVIWILYILVGTFTGSLISISYPLMSSYFHPSIAGSAVGIGNFFLFMSSAIFQQISTSTIPLKGHDEISHKYTWEGYKYGLWLFSAVTLGVSAITILFAKEISSQKKEDPTKAIPNEKSMSSDDIKESGEEEAESEAVSV